VTGKAGVTPNAALLERVARALGGGTHAELDHKQSRVDKSANNGYNESVTKGECVQFSPCAGKRIMKTFLKSITNREGQRDSEEDQILKIPC
jgi:hypothetical protein